MFMVYHEFEPFVARNIDHSSLWLEVKFLFLFWISFFSNIFFLVEVMNDLVLEKQYFIDEVWNPFMMITFFVGHENTRQFYR